MHLKLFPIAPFFINKVFLYNINNKCTSVLCCCNINCAEVTLIFIGADTALEIKAEGADMEGGGTWGQGEEKMNPWGGGEEEEKGGGRER